MKIDGEFFSVCTGFTKKSWRIGGDGISSVVHVKDFKGEREDFLPKGGEVDEGESGYFYFCGPSGEAVFALAPIHWEPCGPEIPTLDNLRSQAGARRDPGYDDLLNRSSIKKMLEVAGIPFREAGEPPGGKGGKVRLLRPVTARKPTHFLEVLSFFLPVLGMLAPLFYMLFSGISGEGSEKVFRQLLAVPWWAIFLSFALPLITFFSTLFLSFAQERTVYSLRPAPKDPATRAFVKLSRVEVRRSGEIVVRDANDLKMWIPPASDAASGVKSAVVLKHGGRPWAVAIIGGEGKLYLFLPWESWFSGDPNLASLRKFCKILNIPLVERVMKPRLKDLSFDHMSRPWPILEDESRQRRPGISGTQLISPVLSMAALWIFSDPTSSHQTLGWSAFGIFMLTLLSCLLHRQVWLRGMVTVPPVSEVEYRWERKQREREPEVDHG
ncbi:ABC transporter ATP-binding protein [Streptomyces alkaliphilus]|uniref:ABC transporter ATP-binding protein n=1 Tax=Streptomyces alkaliphilus TaxID=1472722 RepID=UPI0011816C27|nr:ABC transporter ATP-binding protein [Streptomyces alkaliphilus]MQS06806.1 hypothetical protein [Streptomyces alkaliphilus]